MADLELDFDLQELSERSGITPRTIRFYIQQGVLPPVGAGRGSRKYGKSFLNRLELIRRLQRRHLSLAMIRETLLGMSDDEVVAAVGSTAPDSGMPSAGAPSSSATEYLDSLLGGRIAEGARPSEPTRFVLEASSQAKAAPTPKDAENWPQERTQWERLVLHDDVELHIRRPLSREMNRRLERLLEAARRIFSEP